MSQWKKVVIQRDNGEMVEAQAPVIVSTSRSTDIPAFYAEMLELQISVLHSICVTN